MKYRSSSLTGDGITMAVAAGAATLRKTIEDDDAYVMGTADSLEVEKLSVRGTVGEVEQDENGKYKPETYKLDQIRVRFMAPSTHHTMGGVMVNAQRHMLDNDGNAIAGLYAAGEITGGIHAGNRLGGNAVIEIIVSGRTAAQAIEAGNSKVFHTIPFERVHAFAARTLLCVLSIARIFRIDYNTTYKTGKRVNTHEDEKMGCACGAASGGRRSDRARQRKSRSTIMFSLAIMNRITI